jgi:hypothetical protein
MRDAGKVYFTYLSGSKLPLPVWLYQPCAGEQAAYFQDIRGENFRESPAGGENGGTVQTAVKCDVIEFCRARQDLPRA